MTTIRDVAKRCGVSAMAVSAVLNNRPGKVSPETRARVRLAVEEMGYQPNAIARGLTRRRMNTLGIVLCFRGTVPVTSDRYFSPILDGIFVANKIHHQRSLIIAEDNFGDVEQNIPSYLDGHCDGLVFVVPVLPVEAYQTLVKRRMPFVVIGETVPDDLVSVSDVDNVLAGYDATTYLIENGHRRIGLLKGQEFLFSSGLREIGFRKAMQENGLACDESQIIPGSYSELSGFDRTLMLFGKPNNSRPTALFCEDDAIAIGAWKAVKQLGLRVPQDVSLIGVNDDRGLFTDETALTTIRQPFRMIGEKAIEMTLALVNGEEPGSKALSRGDLMVRNSVAHV